MRQTAREMIEQEMTPDEHKMQVDPHHSIDYRLVAAERVIERLQQRIKELERQVAEVDTHAVRMRQEAEHARHAAEARVEELERGIEPRICATCEKREAYRARLETWVRSMLCGFESAPFQPNTDKRPYPEFLISEAEKYLAAIDAFVAAREQRVRRTHRNRGLS